MHARLLVAVLASCGRLEFAERVDDAAPDVPDAAANEPRLVVAGGPTTTQLEDVALDDAGNLLMLGLFLATLDVGSTSIASQASGHDLYVVAFDRDGALRWHWTAGCSAMCSAQGVEWLADGVVAGGYFSGTLANGGGAMSGSGQDALITWLRTDGSLLLARNFGGTRNVQVRGLEVAGSTVAITGLYADTLDFGNGPLPSAGTFDNAFVASFSLVDRNVKFARAINGSGDIYGNDIAIAPDGSVCVTGRFMTTTDFGGGAVTSNSNDAYVARYDAAGNYQWHVVTRGTGPEAGSYVAMTSDGDCVVSGYYTGAQMFDGLPLPADSAEDHFVARLAASNGAVRWLHALRGPLTDTPIGLSVDARDRIAVAGAFGGTIALPDRTLTSEGGVDGFVLLLTGAGSVLDVHQIGGSGGVRGFQGGTAFSPSGSHVAVGVSFTGELAVTGTGLTATAVDEDAAAIVIPTP